MEAAAVTSTFRSLLTIGVIAVAAALAVIFLSTPISAGAFIGAPAFVVLDGMLLSALVRARPHGQPTMAALRRLIP